MSSKIISAGDLQGQQLQTLQFASFGQGTPNSRLARTTAAIAPKVTLPSNMDLSALLAAAGVDDPAARAAVAAEPSLPASMQVDADEASALLAPDPILDGENADAGVDDASDEPDAEPEPDIPEEPEPQWPTAAELEAIHQEAYQAGYDAGHAEGLARGAEAGHQQAFDQAQQQFDQQVQAFAQLQDAFQANLSELEVEIAPALLKLAVNAVEKLLHDQLATKPDAVLAVIKQALQVIPTEVARATVRAHPADIAALRTFLPTQTPDTLWQFVEDASITQGGCLVDMPSASLDLTLQTRWKALLATLGADADVGA
ncbi:hypothetical protein BXU06_10130 [Aquaspirillum sp. LM1]|uniref:FliH/SctL family protein n=1 Tax=Aquaspirillum sp. LM1 TaxID=1938604 RepID=UPI000983FE96|nr:FliH/SctL family protein [Aquaspirillum sp. LM1]AQR65374.1 hypothetical protein BXU06_10130 [Aquaspirillum sp. LM1]